jgi:hypothetical protein
MSTSAERAAEKFETVQAELREFMADNDEFIDELRRLIENYNASLKEASVAVKSQLKNSPEDRLVIGQFGAMKKRNEKWDGTALAAMFPARISELFLREIVTYEVNVTKLEQLIRQGEIDREEAFKALHIGNPTLSMMGGCPKELRL